LLPKKSGMKVMAAPAFKININRKAATREGMSAVVIFFFFYEIFMFSAFTIT